ncbi:diacylglycerol/lipid kinase family protein [Thalassobaculum sp.]|uniref:diacylglycerol/lipid kinase family protein n=1 Tax=Thalassobaculum sp. TaxID=2022740 RepID=UPI003B58CDBF
MPPRTATLIVNPKAGSLLDNAITPQDIAERVRAAGIEVELLTGDPSELAELVDQAIGRPAELVIVAGGDGTVNAAARRVAGSEKTLGILPSGTLNHLSQDLGIPQDLNGAVAVLAEGEPVEIDIGEVNGHSFLCSSVIGFASRLARQREHWRGRLNPVRWARVIAHLFQTMDRDPAIEVTVTDPKEVTLRTRHLTVAVGDYVDQPGRLFVRTELDSGFLGLYALRSPSPQKLLTLTAKALVGRWRADPELTSERIRTATVRSERKQVRVLNDGEILLLDLPVEYRIRHHALRVIRAPQATEAATVRPKEKQAEIA